MKKNKGFTLIELLIVIVILGILISILAPNLIRARYKALYSACKSNIHNIATILEIYSANDPMKYYPAPDNDKVPFDELQLQGFGVAERSRHCPTNPDAPDSVYGYNVDDDSMPRNYTIECPGDHSAADEDSPMYESGRGFIQQTGP